MISYTAHLKPNRPPVLMREGWTWAGLLFGPIWLLARRGWISALLELAAMALLLGLAPPAAWRPALLGLALFNGVLGRDLVRWSLERAGYALGHVVLAPNQDAALLRLFAARPDLMDPVR